MFFFIEIIIIFNTFSDLFFIIRLLIRILSLPLELQTLVLITYVLLGPVYLLMDQPILAIVVRTLNH